MYNYIHFTIKKYPVNRNTARLQQTLFFFRIKLEFVGCIVISEFLQRHSSSVYLQKAGNWILLVRVRQKLNMRRVGFSCYGLLYTVIVDETIVINIADHEQILYNPTVLTKSCYLICYACLDVRQISGILIQFRDKVNTIPTHVSSSKSKHFFVIKSLLRIEFESSHVR